MLELVVLATVVGSVLAIGSVHEWARAPLWSSSAVAFALAAARANLEGGIARRLRAEARPPLLLPGALFLCWVTLQIVPLPWDGADMPWRALTLSVPASLRGMAFVAAALGLHLAAAVGLEDRSVRRRALAVIEGLGLAIGLLALLEWFSGSTRIYWLFEPREAGTAWGPFVNRNNLAGYLLLIIPLCLGGVWRAVERARARLGPRRSWRSYLVSGWTRDAPEIVNHVIPALVCGAALVVTMSRGGLLALAAGLIIGALAGRQRFRAGSAALLLVGVVAAFPLVLYGYSRVGDRLDRIGDDAGGRLAIWGASLQHAKSRPWAGSGFNTFEAAVSRVPAWRLPDGATPWPEELRPELLSSERVGYWAPASMAGLNWYREAHNDYLQLLVETGVVGLALGLWGAIAVLTRASGDPWLVAALSASLFHAAVDFDFQIPSIPVLFVVLAAMPRRSRVRDSEAASHRQPATPSDLLQSERQ